MIQAEKDVAAHMLASLTTGSLQNLTRPTREQVAHHFRLACEKTGFVGTEESSMRILRLVSHEIRKAPSVLNLVNRREGPPQ
ncbi:hypothetical protein [Bradyrhizobium iriomotense]|uniref:Uncharacterized protein n=1 Tax=Bradyrhizobium iriomotense TaxID=441950 RepID=A0ABQ6B835_9BRAD|nr:hypothetical protein [Bradyrhizobium iriomotense]GLR89641.1 hypothetical protein GCM10007857_63550 [Bradyrhizobium iriomotense]